MKRIERYSNWCYVDRLNSVDLKDGELLNIKWPTGIITEKVCHIDKYTKPISDMGSPYDVPYREAFVLIDFEGLICKAYIVGLEAERV